MSMMKSKKSFKRFIHSNFQQKEHYLFLYLQEEGKLDSQKEQKTMKLKMHIGQSGLGWFE